MVRIRGWVSSPGMLTMSAVGVVMGGLLVGYQPIGGDPDLLYRPIKAEYARALAEGRLPFWSDLFGLGTPLVAESHVAAFYPPNLVLYRLLGVDAAYRLSMWLHFVATAGLTYAYARTLGLSAWGGVLAGVSFALSGFQASHSGHEPFYTAVAFLPLSLLLVERFMAAGGVAWLAGLAMAIGSQLTLGHFQVPMMTEGLVLLTALWRAGVDRRPWTRAIGVGLALAWGGAIAAVQLGLTRELTGFIAFDRAIEFLMTFQFPIEHWFQPALPHLFTGLVGPGLLGYYGTLKTISDEAWLYVGTIPLILACLALAAGRDRALRPWRWIVGGSLVLATMVSWWPDGYWAILHVPGLGYFRAPGRYTLLTCLGLCLFAGRGLDRSISRRRAGIGLMIAVAIGAAAGAAGVAWSGRPDVRAVLGDSRTPLLIGSAVAWAVGLAAVAAWRGGRVGPWAPTLLAALELTILYYRSDIEWGWSIPIPEASPALTRLAEEPDVGLVRTSQTNDIVVRAGQAVAYPYLGIFPPAPNFLLEPAVTPGLPNAIQRRWLWRFGVSHGIWEGTEPTPRSELIYVGPDPVLDRLVGDHPDAPPERTWRVERYPGAAPPAHVATVLYVADDWFEMYPTLSNRNSLDEVWYLREDRPPESPGPRANSARLLRWDGRSGEVEHDGTCDLVIRRTFYPGWFARADDGPEAPVRKADSGLQAVHLPGAGTTRISLEYRPTGLPRLATLSLAATGSALLVLAATAVRRWRRARRDD